MADACTPPIVEVIVTNQPVQQTIVQQTAQQAVVQQTAQQILSSASVIEPVTQNELDQTSELTQVVVQNVGPQGPPGVGTVPVFVMPAGEQIYGHRAVRAINGQLFNADPTQPVSGTEIAGVALNATAIGNNATVQTDGPLSDPSWNWSPGTIWVGLSGILTQTLPSPSSGFAWLYEIGCAVSATEIVINPRFVAEF